MREAFCNSQRLANISGLLEVVVQEHVDGQLGLVQSFSQRNLFSLGAAFPDKLRAKLFLLAADLEGDISVVVDSVAETSRDQGDRRCRFVRGILEYLSMIFFFY